MKKFSLLFLCLVMAAMAYTQVPKKFQYQAVARDGSGNVLQEQSLTIRIGILQDGAMVWQEDHDVVTNSMGLFNLQVGGPDAYNASGTAGSFDQIDWSMGTYEMNISVDDGNGFADLGTSEMLSVPYALVAGNGSGNQTLSLSGNMLSISDGNEVDLSTLQDGVEDADADPSNEIQDLEWSGGNLSITGGSTVADIDGRIASRSGWQRTNDTIFSGSWVGIGTDRPHQSELMVQGFDETSEEPLFQVRRKDGIPVFAVYNDGVMVYVDESQKGIKGGFAVGGYSNAKKGVTQEYLRITPDSVRIYVPEQPAAKGVKGGFAVGGYSNDGKAATRNFLEVNRTSTNVYFDTTTLTKGVKGGFAVGGYTSSKGEVAQLMDITPDNYLIGEDAGVSLTSGRYNSFLGYRSGYNNTTGSNNVFLGRLSGHNNLGANENIFIGNESGYNTAGGYGNTYIGNQSGFQNESGFYNSFLGYQSGYRNTSHYNSFFGYQAGYGNTSGSYNSFFGYQAGYNNTTGSNNIFLGLRAGYGSPTTGAGITGSYNIFMGDWSGYNNLGGANNVFLGYYSGRSNTQGNHNIFMGTSSGYNNSTGNRNVFIGNESGYGNTTGYDNVFIGNRAGRSGQTGIRNVYIGETAGYNNVSGSYNTVMGYQSGYGLSGGESDFNTIIGYQAGHDMRNAYRNVLIGYRAGYKVRDNRYNIIIGEDAGYNLAGTLGEVFSGQANLIMGQYAGYTLTTGSKNIFLGLDTGFDCDPEAEGNVWIGLAAGRSSASSGSVFLGKYAGYNEDADNKLIIQTDYTGSDNLNNALVYGDFVTKFFRHNGHVGINYTGNSAWALTVGMEDSDTYGLVVYGPTYCTDGAWTGSDLRLKKNVEDYNGALDKVKRMRGVSFNWRTEEFPERRYDTDRQVGVIAQEIEEVVPEVVTEGPEGYKSVDYAKLSAVLIEAVKEQQEQIEALERRIAELEK